MVRKQAQEDGWATIRDVLSSRPDGTEVGLSVYLFGSGQTLSIDGERDFASASTIKILILAALARGFDEGRFSPEDKIAVREDLKLEGSGVLNWLETGLRLSLHDHAWLMTAISDNTASNICIETVGLDEINALGNEIGVGKTHLGRMFMGANAPPGPPKNRATADGLVAILKAIENDTAASPERCAWMRSCLDDQQHVDRLPRHLPEGISYRGKTGTIQGIAHDCGALTGPGGRIALAVLTEGFRNPYDADRLIGRIGAAAASLVAGND
ncbi:MAG TPA: serine hydrolase [Thermomicrobiales bacterium]|nr:serine hydrolase [Thermomicrobiales bacterium]